MRIKKGRYKKDPFTIEATFPPPHENVKLKVIGHADALSSLATDYYENPEALGKLLLNRFLDPAIWEIFTECSVGPRGIHAATWKFIQEMRIKAPYTFCLIDYWLKRPREKWPKPIKTVIEEFQQKPSKLTGAGKRKKPTALQVTAYIMERDFGREREENNPAASPWTKDPDGFKKTYIRQSHFTDWIKLQLKELKASGIEISPTLSIITDKPWQIILSLFPKNHV